MLQFGDNPVACFAVVTDNYGTAGETENMLIFYEDKEPVLITKKGNK